MALGASQRLHDGVAAVETMTRFALAVLALASGVYTYLGSAAFSTAPRRRSSSRRSSTRPRFPSASTLLVLYGPLLSACDHPYGPGRHAGRDGSGCGHDHRHVELAQCGGAGRFRRARTASRGNGGGLYRRPRPGASERACGPEPAARHPARIRTLRSACRLGAAIGSAHRHDRVRKRGAASVADVGADEGSGEWHKRLPRTCDGAFQSGTEAARNDADAGLRAGCGRTACRSVLLGSGGAHRRHNVARTDFDRAFDPPRRRRPVARLHRTRGRRRGCRSRQSPGPGDGDCASLGGGAIQGSLRSG